MAIYYNTWTPWVCWEELGSTPHFSCQIGFVYDGGRRMLNV